MTTFNSKIFGVLVASALILGCEEKTGEKSAAPGEAVAPKVGSQVLISVNGVELTEKEFDDWVELKQSVILSSVKDGYKVSKSGLGFVRDQMLASVTNSFIAEVAVRSYAAENGIAASKADLDRCRKGFVAAMKRVKNWNAATNRLGSALSTVAEGRIATEALALAVKRDFFAKTNVLATAEEIDSAYGRYCAYNAECAKTNDMVWANASNIWRRAVSGEDFEKLADEFNEDEDKPQNGAWGEFKIADFNDEPAIRRLYREFRKDYVSPPVEADNGLMIFKVVDIIDGDEDVDAPGYLPSPEAEYTMKRIYFHLPMFIESVSKEVFAKEAEAAKRNQAYIDFLRDLCGKTKVEFPNGTDMFNPKKKGAKAP